MTELLKEGWYEGEVVGVELTENGLVKTTYEVSGHLIDHFSPVKVQVHVVQTEVRTMTNRINCSNY